MLPSCTAGPGPWRARADLCRKTDVYWDTSRGRRAAAGQGPLCAFYSSRYSVSGIRDNPATKWDRAGKPGGSLFLFRRRGSRSRSRAGRGISLNSTHKLNIIHIYQT